MKWVNKLLPVGPRSVLFGAHCFFIHPWFVWWAWIKLYGWTWSFPTIVSFFIHDLGYLFYWCPNMDGVEGERHPEFAANVMHFLFDQVGAGYYWQWYDFTLYHSRFYAKAHNKPFSRLCVADKLAFCLTPAWIYLPMVNLSGEIHEYMELAKKRTAAGEPKYASMNVYSSEQKQWHANVVEYLWRWVEEHCDATKDNWTPCSTK